MAYEHIVSAFFAEPWLILPQKGRAIAEVLAMRVRGERLSADEIRAIVAAKPARATAGNTGAVAVIPVYGVMAPRVGELEESSGAVSTDRIARTFRAAVDDPGVSSIVMDIDSPGGSVYGTDELATSIYQARGRKPIVAVANQMAASAAYYIASQADEVIITPSGEVGSIGVWTEHWDMSEALAGSGLKPTIIQAGRFKTEGNPYEPLSAEAREFEQSRVNAYYDAFIRAVARGRNVSASVARSEQFGQGRMYGAREAVQRGMADRIGTLDDAITRAAGGRVGRTAAAWQGATVEAGNITIDLATAAREELMGVPEPVAVSDLDARTAGLRLAEAGA